jgi:hypothetical protein
MQVSYQKEVVFHLNPILLFEDEQRLSARELVDARYGPFLERQFLHNTYKISGITLA